MSYVRVIENQLKASSALHDFELLIGAMMHFNVMCM